MRTCVWAWAWAWVYERERERQRGRVGGKCGCVVDTEGSAAAPYLFGKVGNGLGARFFLDVQDHDLLSLIATQA